MIGSAEAFGTQNFREARLILQGIGNLYLDRVRRSDFDESFFHELLRSTVQESTQLASLYILDAEGHPLAAGNTFPLSDESRSKTLKSDMGVKSGETEFHLGPFDQSTVQSGDRISGRWFIPAVFPALSEEKKIQGYVVAVFAPEVFSSFFSSLEVGEHGLVQLWDRRGVLITANQNAEWEIGTQVQEIAERIARYKLLPEAHSIYTAVSIRDGWPIVSSHLLLEDLDLGLSIALSGEDFLHGWRIAHLNIIFQAITFLTVLLAVIYYLLKQLKRLEASERLLFVAKEEAERANSAKNAMLAQVSHEFRTPLNAIIGFSQSIAEKIFGPELSEKYREYACDIQNSGKHLLELVNDIIDYSRIESGDYRVNVSTVNVDECVRNVSSMLSPLADTQKVNIAARYSDTDACIETDERLIKQVLINLLSNAIKFSDVNSEISIDVVRDGQEGIEIIISDQGKGISDSVLSRVGQPFLTEDPQTYSNGEGTGLGLSIVKKSMDILGGRLSLESREGTGTNASIWLPNHFGEPDVEDGQSV